MDIGYRILDTGYWLQIHGYTATRYMILDTGYWISDTWIHGYRILAKGY